MALTHNALFADELRKRIAEERAGRLANLGNGSAPDHGAYRDQVGYLRALQDVCNWCDEVRTEMDKR